MCCYYGAPYTMTEKLSGGDMVYEAVKTIQPLIKSQTEGKNFAGFLSVEIGGFNSLILTPLCCW